MPVAGAATVRVMRGEDKGTEGRSRVFRKTGRVTVEGINNREAASQGAKGRGDERDPSIAAPITFNVMLLDPKKGMPKRSKRSHRRDGTKERISAKSGEAIPPHALSEDE